MENVYLKRCETYDFDNLKNAIREALSTTTFANITNFDSVFIKVNCLGPFEEDLAITTNPTFLKAVIELVKEKTSKILVGDNPASHELVSCLKKNGMYNVIQEENVDIFDPSLQKDIKNTHPTNYSSFKVSSQMMEADYLINLPKLKTHSLTYFTCAQKNLFGTIYGFNKSSWHVKAPNPLAFANALCDLYGAIKEQFDPNHIISICDAIDCLEGEGPSTSGKKCHVGAIITSCDAIALDRVAIEVAGLDYKKYALNNIAGALGLGENNLDNILINGNLLEDFNDIHIREPEKNVSSTGIKLLQKKTIRNLCLEHPKVDKSKCIRCGECTRICSSHAMTIENGKTPHLDSSKCIRCWCCSEICPRSAISKSRRPIIGKILFK